MLKGFKLLGRDGASLSIVETDEVDTIAITVADPSSSLTCKISGAGFHELCALKYDLKVKTLEVPGLGLALEGDSRG